MHRGNIAISLIFLAGSVFGGCSSNANAEDGEGIYVLGGYFQLWKDASRAPMFRVQRWRYEPRWWRPAPSASAADCRTLDSEQRPVVVNTHRRLMESGLMAEYPYLFREMCLSPGKLEGPAAVAAAAGYAPARPLGGTAGEKMFVAEARRVWVLKHGAMVTSASLAGVRSGPGSPGQGVPGGGVMGHIVVQHVEYHSLEVPADGVARMPVEYADRLVNVAQAHASNYYHFLCEVLPRLLMLPRKLLHDPRTKILLPPLAQSREAWALGGGGFVGGLLHLLGLSEGCLVGGGGAGGASVAAGTAAHRLVFALRVYFPSYSPFRIHSQTPRLGLRVLRARLLSALGGAHAGGQDVDVGWTGQGVWAQHWLDDSNEKGGGSEQTRAARGRVLVSMRGPGSDRGSEISDVQNWGEFVGALRRAYAQELRCGSAEAKVQAVEPGEMSLMQQAEQFSSASAVVGAHGSNLANIVWLQEGGAVVEIHRPAQERGPRYNNFWYMAGALGLRYRVVVAAQGFLLAPSHAQDIARFLSE